MLALVQSCRMCLGGLGGVVGEKALFDQQGAISQRSQRRKQTNASLSRLHQATLQEPGRFPSWAQRAVEPPFLLRLARSR